MRNETPLVRDLMRRLRELPPNTPESVALLSVVGLRGEEILAPVVPIPHHDSEIGFNVWHCHYDFRFFTQLHLKALLPRRKINPAIVAPLYDFTILETAPMPLQRGWRKLFGCASETIHTHCPTPDKAINKKALKCGRCPHKGFQFDGSNITKDGIMECPLHGMKFKILTGERVRIRSPFKDPIYTTC